MRVVISSGHGKYVRGAAGYLDEVDEARQVVNEVAALLLKAGIATYVFHDDVSHSQNENLRRIVDAHNAQVRELDVSVHFNAYVETTNPMGTECLYLTQDELAATVAHQIASAGDFPNRGAKQRGDLYFLNNTEQPAILIEVCFVDSEADAAHYDEHFDAICFAIARCVAGYGRPRDELVDA